MTVDYQGNSNKDKEPKPDKVVEKVAVGEVIVQKRSLGKKIRDLFVEADFRSVAGYVVHDVMIPAARNLIVDTATKGVERLFYGESASRYRRYGAGGGPRVTYNNPVQRGYTSSAHQAPPITVGSRTARYSRDDFILSSREDAAKVLEQMGDIIDTFDFVSVSDLNEMVGLPHNHVDTTWGWVFLGDAQIRQVREGFLLDLPPAESLR